MANNIFKPITGAAGAAFSLQPASGQTLNLKDSFGNDRLWIDGAAGAVYVAAALLPSTTGTRDVGSATYKYKDAYFAGDVTIDGGDIFSSASSFNLLNNANTNTVNAFAGAETIVMGSTSTGTCTIRNTNLVGKALKVDSIALAALNTAPANASDTGTTGEIRIDASYIYVCTATNTWKRVAIATW